jgi:hypothetical protein
MINNRLNLDNLSGIPGIFADGNRAATTEAPLEPIPEVAIHVE